MVLRVHKFGAVGLPRGSCDAWGAYVWCCGTPPSQVSLVLWYVSHDAGLAVCGSVLFNKHPRNDMDRVVVALPSLGSF